MIQVNECIRNYANNDRTPPTVQLEVLDVYKAACPAHSSILCGMASHAVLVLVLSGEVLMDQTGPSIPSNRVIYIPQYRRFHLSALRESEVILVTFGYQGPLPVLKDKGAVLEAGLEVCGYFQQLYRHKHDHSSLPGIPDSLLLLLLDRLQAEAAGGTALPAKAIRWIEQHAKIDITAGDVADAMNCSVAHLNRLLNRETGRCLSEWIVQARLREIRQWLSLGTRNTAAMAEALGFSSAELLRKYFKYHTGMSLREFAATHPLVL